MGSGNEQDVTGGRHEGHDVEEGHEMVRRENERRIGRVDSLEAGGGVARDVTEHTAFVIDMFAELLVGGQGLGDGRVVVSDGVFEQFFASRAVGVVFRVVLGSTHVFCSRFSVLLHF